MSAAAGEPIDAEVIVRQLVPAATQRFGDSVVPLGDSARIELAGIQVILNTVRSQVFSPDVFVNLGIDPTRQRLLVVKSTNHFHAAFEPIAGRILYAAVDGPYPKRSAHHRLPAPAARAVATRRAPARGPFMKPRTIESVTELETPAVLIDERIVARNIERFQQHCDKAGLALRPHIKTHKLPHLAHAQVQAGAPRHHPARRSPRPRSWSRPDSTTS